MRNQILRLVPRFRLAGILLISAGFAGCSGPPVMTVEKPVVRDDAVSSFDGLSYVWVATDGASLRSADGFEQLALGTGGNISFHAFSPVGNLVVVAISDSDGSRLVLVDGSSPVSSVIHTGSPDLVYTGAWSASGMEFAFGYYRPIRREGRDGMGVGAINIVTAADGSVRSVGCSASKAVVAWPSSDELLVRTTDSIYRVAAQGCGTRQTIDARRWHFVTVAGDGARVAYILRELVYNRDKREYEPDSTLYFMPTSGGEPTRIVGDRYRPRNMTWSSDGSELAFDVRSSTDSEKRSISIYIIEAGETVYLNTPSDSSPSEHSPSWSPGGDHLGYTTGSGNLMIRTFSEPFARPVDLGTEDERPIRITGWLNDGTVIVTGSAGGSYLYDVAAARARYAGPGSLVAISPSF